MNPEYSLNSLVTNPPSAADEIRFYEPIIQAFGPHLFLKVTQYGQEKMKLKIILILSLFLLYIKLEDFILLMEKNIFRILLFLIEYQEEVQQN